MQMCAVYGGKGRSFFRVAARFLTSCAHYLTDILVLLLLLLLQRLLCQNRHGTKPLSSLLRGKRKSVKRDESQCTVRLFVRKACGQQVENYAYCVRAESERGQRVGAEY